MKKVIRLTESDLINVIKRIIKEEEKTSVSFKQAFPTKESITKSDVTIFSSDVNPDVDGKYDSVKGSTLILRKKGVGRFYYNVSATYGGVNFDVTLSEVHVGKLTGGLFGLAKPKNSLIQWTVKSLIPKDYMEGDYITFNIEKSELKNGLNKLWDNNGSSVIFDTDEGVKIKLTKQ